MYKATTAWVSNGAYDLNGDKVDFWMLTEDPFDRSRFARRYYEEVLGIRFAVSSPEDTILMNCAGPRSRGEAKNSSSMPPASMKCSLKGLTRSISANGH
jgi:hypothetical protein